VVQRLVVVGPSMYWLLEWRERRGNREGRVIARRSRGQGELVG
jgi:hypothetical protein